MYRSHPLHTVTGLNLVAELSGDIGNRLIDRPEIIRGYLFVLYRDGEVLLKKNNQFDNAMRIHNVVHKLRVVVKLVSASKEKGIGEKAPYFVLDIGCLRGLHSSDEKAQIAFAVAPLR
jgi:hypothetical protein